MATNYVKYDGIVLLQEVKESFTLLAADVYQDIGIGITVADGYKYEWDVVDELKSKIKDVEIKKSIAALAYVTSSLVNNFASDKIKLADIAFEPSQSSVTAYGNVLVYINTLPPTEFEPPIGPNLPAKRDISGNELVYSIPNYPQLDPRRTGRVIKIGPKAATSATLLRYLVQNAGKYGFIHYGPFDPLVWYWRGDKFPITDADGTQRNYYTSQECVNTFTGELSYLL